MYRDGYSEQPINQFNPNISNYSYHPNPSIKLPNPETIPPPAMIHHNQNPQLYYEPTNSMMDQGYSMMPMDNTY